MADEINKEAKDSIEKNDSKKIDSSTVEEFVDKSHKKIKLSNIKKGIIAGTATLGAICAIVGCAIKFGNDDAYTITINTNMEGVSDYNFDIKKGTNIKQLKAYLKPVEGYKVEGIYKDIGCTQKYDDDELISNDMQIFVKYEEIKYTVTVFGEDKTTVLKTYEAKPNITLELEDASKASDEYGDYVFDGWVDEFNHKVDLTNITSDLAVYPSFQINYKEYEIADFASQVKIIFGGKELTSSDTLHYGNRISISYTPTENFEMKNFDVVGAEWNEELQEYEVTGNLSVVYEEEQVYFAINNIAEHVAITKNGERLNVGDKVRVDDKLKIAYTETEDYEMSKFEVNGEKKTAIWNEETKQYELEWIVAGEISVAYEEVKVYFAIDSIAEHVVVTRDGVTLTTADKVRVGDKLDITYTETEDFEMTKFKVDGATLNEETHKYEVTGNLSIAYEEVRVYFAIGSKSENVTITKNGESLNVGDKIRVGDKLKIAYTLAIGHYVNRFEVNGEKKTATLNEESKQYELEWTVAGDLSVTYEQALLQFAISNNFETNVSITRDGEKLNNGAAIWCGDELEITYTETEGYRKTGFEVGGAQVFDGKYVVESDLVISYEEVSILNYEEFGDGYQVVGLNFANEENVKIMNTYGGKPVTKIANLKSSTMKSVVIPNSITSIENNAFENCTALASVAIPASVKTIGRDAFNGCSSLESITFEKDTTLEILSVNLFANCEALKSVTIPKSVKTLGASAFNTCTSLSAVNFEKDSQLETIENLAFECCNGLTSITIPASVTTIGDLAFGGLNGLTTVNFEAESKLETIGSETFSQTGITSITIPASVKTIGNMAFAECSNLASFEFETGNKIVALPVDMFSNCTALKTVNIPNSVTQIDGAIFTNCSSDLVVYCEAASKPEGWNDNWNVCDDAGTRVLAFFGVGSECVDSYGVKYKLNADKTLNVVGYDSEKLKSEIVFNWLTSEIQFNTFKDCATLKNITIPASVKTIGSTAFNGCTNLQNVTFEEGSLLETINSNAFYGCTALTNITIPASVKTIGNSAFQNCLSLKTVTFEEGCLVQNINGVFSSCSSLVSINVPAAVTNMGQFANLKNLESVTFEEGSKIENIGNSAFYGCSALKNVTIPASVKTIGTAAFYGCTTLTNITIPASVKTIYSSAFSGCTNLQSLTFEEGSLLEIINSNAFYGCGELTKVVLPNNVKTIGNSVFGNCYKISEMYLPASITSIDYGNSSSRVDVVYYCGVESKPSSWKLNWNTIYNFTDSTGQRYNVKYAAITGVTPEEYQSISVDEYGVKYIAKQDGSKRVVGYDKATIKNEIVIQEGTVEICAFAFYNCESLTNVTLPGGLKFIGASAFYNCVGIIDIVIPNSVTSIESSAFYYTNIEKLYIPASVSTINNSIMNNKNSVAIIFCEAASKPDGWVEYWNGEYEVFGGVTPEEYQAVQFETDEYGVKYYTTSAGEKFVVGYDKDALASDVVIQEGTTKIANYSFYNCAALKNVTLPSGLKTIGIYAFSGSGLTRVTIPVSVTTLGHDVFYDCNDLAEVVFEEGNQLEIISECAFQDCDVLASVNLPSSLKIIGASAFNCCYALTSIVIPESVTSINECAFLECENLESVTFETESQLEYLGCEAFDSCYALTNFVINNGVNNIVFDNEVFENCTGLESIVISSNVTSIGEYVFGSCESLANVIFEEGSQLETIGCDAFCSCYALTSITIPKSVTLIDSYAFESCENLVSVIFEEGSQLETIVYDAFAYCYALKNITIPASVKTIEGECFYECTSLESVTFEKGSLLESIGSNSFEGCTALKMFNIPASVTTVESNVFYGLGSDFIVCCEAENKPEGWADDWDVCNNDGAKVNVVWGGFAINNVLYRIIDGKQTALGVVSSEGVKEIVIAEGTKVIASGAFANGKFKKVTLPSSLETIETAAFANCDELKLINIPANVTSIAAKAFDSYDLVMICEAESEPESWHQDWTTGYVKANAVVWGVTLAEYQAISADEYGVKYLTKQDGSKYVVGYDSDTIANEVVIQEGTVKIVANAFNYSYKIKEIYIPGSVTEIGGYPFEQTNNIVIYCEAASKPEGWSESWCDYEDGNPAYVFWGVSLDEYNSGRSTDEYGVKYFVDKNGTKFAVGVGYNEVMSNTNIVIQDGTVEICNFAFSGMKNVDTIYIPASVTVINTWAFEYYNKVFLCEAESKPEGWIGSWNSSNIIWGVTKDVQQAISADEYGVKYLIKQDGSKYVVGYDKNTIKDYVVIQTETIQICDDAFYDCENLKELYIPASVTKIGSYILNNAGGSENNIIIFCEATSKPADWSNSWHGMSYNNVIWGVTPEEYNLITTDEYGVRYLTKQDGSKYVVGHDKNTIKDNIVVQDGTVGICDYVFYGCLQYKKVYIPASVATINSGSFTRANGIAIYCEAASKPAGWNNDWKGNSRSVYWGSTLEQFQNGNFEIDEYGVKYYITNDGSRSVVGYDANVFKNNVIIKNNTYRIEDYAFNGCTALTNIIIPSSVTSIGNYAFYKCSSLTNITIPSSVTSIGDDAFGYCEKLASVTFEEGIKLNKVEDWVFAHCKELKSIVLPASVTSIGRYAFYDCESLTNITIPTGVTSIGDYVFEDCERLENVTFEEGSSLRVIPDSAFRYCTSLSNIIIPTSVTSIGDYAFYDCGSLKTITIPSGVTSIGYSVFEGCSSLTSITIPSSVTSIGDYAFEDCVSLTSITIPSSVTKVGYRLFYNINNNNFVVCCEAASKPDGWNAEWDLCDYSSGAKVNVVWGCTIDETGNVIVEEQGVKYRVNNDGTFAVVGYDSTKIQANVVLKAGTVEIANGAFQNCDIIKTIYISESVISVESSAFFGCTNLTIYCAAASEPAGWNFAWNNSDCKVVWGVTAEQYNTAISGKA